MATASQMPIKPEVVTITFKDGKLAVNKDTFVVHKHGDQMVKWVCKPDPKTYFTIDFENGSPFYESQFSRDHPCSGLVRRNILPDTGKVYKYTVRVGNKFLDPGGEVDK